MEKNSNLDLFEQALRMLDDRLATANLSIEVRAIGGFAMLYYGIRDNGVTIDIDSLTYAYNEDVLKYVSEVGRALNIEEDWLNTDCASLQGFIKKLGKQINWVDAGYSFVAIDFKIADLYGLLRSKAKAIEDGGLVPRKTDKNDCVHILCHLGVNNIKNLTKNENLVFIREEYPRCYKFLEELREW